MINQQNPTENIKGVIPMNLRVETQNLDDYLQQSEIIDYRSPAVVDLARTLAMGESGEINLAKKVFHYVRDEIDHSGDIGATAVTCSASQVLAERHGICCAKAHLLAAILRYLGIPTGFCYQWLVSDNDQNQLVLHGLNAVYLKTVGKWIRLDARGNKPGVQAEFSIDTEKLAWPVRSELGEEDDPLIYIEPNPQVVQILQETKDRSGFWERWATIKR